MPSLLVLQAAPGLAVLCESHGRWQVHALLGEQWDCRAATAATRVSAFRARIDAQVPNCESNLLGLSFALHTNAHVKMCVDAVCRIDQSKAQKFHQ